MQLFSLITILQMRNIYDKRIDLNNKRESFETMEGQSNKWKKMQLLSLPGITKALNLLQYTRIFKQNMLTVVSQNALQYIQQKKKKSRKYHLKNIKLTYINLLEHTAICHT